MAARCAQGGAIVVLLSAPLAGFVVSALRPGLPLFHSDRPESDPLLFSDLLFPSRVALPAAPVQGLHVYIMWKRKRRFVSRRNFFLPQAVADFGRCFCRCSGFRDFRVVRQQGKQPCGCVSVSLRRDHRRSDLVSGVGDPLARSR